MIKTNIQLKDISNYKIGGNADYFLEITSKEALTEGLLEWDGIARDKNLEDKIFVFGQGTNVLFSDNGYRGLIIHNKIDFIKERENTVSVGAGVLVKDLINFCTKRALSGFEWAGGLPGTLGGGIRGNAGAFGGEIKDVVLSVESVDEATRKITDRNWMELGFDYRTSIFKEGEAKDEIILSAALKFNAGVKEDIEKATQEKIDYRKERHPIELPNIGSTFKNIDWNEVSPEQKAEFYPYIKNDPFPILPVAKILSLAGLKGERVGDAQVSEKHPNFIVNLGNAKSSDVLSLISRVKEVMKQKYGFSLEEEIMYLAEA